MVLLAVNFEGKMMLPIQVCNDYFINKYFLILLTCATALL